MKWRVIYGILCLLSLMAFFMPWSQMGSTTYNGWNYIVPFSFTYFIGLILSIVVFFTRYKAVGMTITAGILMFLGALGGIVGAGITSGVSEATGSTAVHISLGLVLAFVMSITYPILGTIAGNRLKKTDVVVESK